MKHRARIRSSSEDVIRKMASEDLEKEIEETKAFLYGLSKDLFELSKTLVKDFE